MALDYNKLLIYGCSAVIVCIAGIYWQPRPAPVPPPPAIVTPAPVAPAACDCPVIVPPAPTPPAVVVPVPTPKTAPVTPTVTPKPKPKPKPRPLHVNDTPANKDPACTRVPAVAYQHPVDVVVAAAKRLGRTEADIALLQRCLSR